MYGQRRYGTVTYSDDTTEAEERRKHKDDLTIYAPEFMMQIIEMKEIYEAEGIQIGNLFYAMQSVIDQMFLTSATWGLQRWEKLFGIKSSLDLSYERRREIIQAHLRGTGTTTIEMIKETAIAFSGGEVEITEDAENSRFIVCFIGIKGTPPNMKSFINMLEEIKPAHLAYEFEYRYTVWQEMQNGIWNSLKNITWDEIKTLEEA